MRIKNILNFGRLPVKLPINFGARFVQLNLLSFNQGNWLIWTKDRLLFFSAVDLLIEIRLFENWFKITDIFIQKHFG